MPRKEKLQTLGNALTIICKITCVLKICFYSHLLMPALIGLGHVMSHGGTLKSKGY